MQNKSNYDKFIEKCHLLYGNKYIYNKVEYKTLDDTIIVTCPEHGDFAIKPHNHLKGYGCKVCKSIERKEKYQQKFISKANKLFNHKYDYSKVECGCATDFVTIHCNIHGDFKLRCSSHLKGFGCKVCQQEERNKQNKETFLKRARVLHGNKYTYSNVEYTTHITKVHITCPKHGDFIQTPCSHLRGAGCPVCKKEEDTIRYKSEFIDSSNLIYNYKYDYSHVEYVKTDVKVSIICPEHGIFKQAPRDHLKGGGCSKCSRSKGEKYITSTLEQHGIDYEIEYIFEDCRDKRPLPFDFYLPSKGVLIEYHGIQHYEYIDYFHRDTNKFELQKCHDQIKVNYCITNNIRLVIIPYTDYKSIPEIVKEIL